MKRFDADQEQLAEPIVVILDGKEYTVKKITTSLMAKVSDLSKGKDNVNAPVWQLALLLGSSYEELKNVDIRKVGKALKYITECLQESFEAKNPSAAEAKS